MRKKDHNSGILYNVRWPSVFREEKIFEEKHSSDHFTQVPEMRTLLEKRTK